MSTQPTVTPTPDPEQVDITAEVYSRYTLRHGVTLLMRLLLLEESSDFARAALINLVCDLLVDHGVVSEDELGR